MSQNGHAMVERAIPALDRLPRRMLARAESLPAGSMARGHRHDWHQLSYAMNGVLGVRTATGSYIAPPQRAVWVPAGVEHEVSNSLQAEMRSLYIQPCASRRDRRRCEVLLITPLLRELILAVTSLPVEYDEQGPAGRLVTVLLDQLDAAASVAFNLPWPTDARLVRVCDALQSAPDDGRTLVEWGREVGLADRSLARLFREQTGLSFGDWRLRLRLLLSLNALEAGASVTQVALEAGYQSTSAFIAAFRRVFGTTPRQADTLQKADALPG